MGLAVLAIGCGQGERAHDAARGRATDSELLADALPGYRGDGERPPQFVKRRDLGTDGTPREDEIVIGGATEQLAADMPAPIESPSISQFGVTFPDGSDYDVILTAADFPPPEVARALEQEDRQDALPEPATPSAQVDKGISLNADGRYHWTGETTFPKRTIGAWVTVGARKPEDYVSFCTGTLIGPRVVLTAAHCVYDERGNLIPAEFVAGKDGTYSSPYGYSPRGPVWRNSEWMDKACYGSASMTAFCSARDYAVVVLRDPPQAGDGKRPGSMGWKSHLDVLGLTLLRVNSAGYPWWGDFPPRGCTDDWLYRDDDCAADPNHRYGSGGYAQLRFSCDTSSGHSGGPIWSTGILGIEGDNRLVALVSTSRCRGFSCFGEDRFYPNHGVLITPALSDLMSMVKANNP